MVCRARSPRVKDSQRTLETTAACQDRTQMLELKLGKVQMAARDLLLQVSLRASIREGREVPAVALQLEQVAEAQAVAQTVELSQIQEALALAITLEGLGDQMRVRQQEVALETALVDQMQVRQLAVALAMALVDQMLELQLVVALETVLEVPMLVQVPMQVQEDLDQDQVHLRAHQLPQTQDLSDTKAATSSAWLEARVSACRARFQVTATSQKSL